MIPTPDGDPQRWVVVWGQRLERETYIGDKALAVAYAAAHHGVVVGLMPVGEWPGVNSGVKMGQPEGPNGPV